MVKFQSQESDQEENEYDEEDFELDDDHEENDTLHVNAYSQSVKSLKKSASSIAPKRLGTPGTGSNVKSNSKSSSPKKESTASQEKSLDVDLERYLNDMGSDEEDVEEKEKESRADELAKAMRPLDGIRPNKADEDQAELMKKLGYSHASDDSPSKGTNSSKGSSPVKKSVKLQIKEEPKQREEVPPSSSSFLPGEEPDQAVKINAFLAELFPERYNQPAAEHKKAKKSSKKTEKSHAPPKQAVGGKSHHPPAPAPAARHYYDEEEEEDHADHSSSPDNVLSNLDSQLKLLKRDLKLKDDKIVRLKDHSSLMATHLDRLKEEIARLNNKLQDAELVLEAKDMRIAELLKAKKKLTSKKASSSLNGHDHHEKSLANLETENMRLKEREQALMDAVEELSTQNEDLIVKLRESMQRELELSSKRAAMVNHAIIPRGDSMLPSIYGKEHDVVRTQSEPVEVSRPRYQQGVGKKKKKHN